MSAKYIKNTLPTAMKSPYSDIHANNIGKTIITVNSKGTPNIIHIAIRNKTNINRVRNILPVAVSVPVEIIIPSVSVAFMKTI